MDRANIRTKRPEMEAAAVSAVHIWETFDLVFKAILVHLVYFSKNKKAPNSKTAGRRAKGGNMGTREH